MSMAASSSSSRWRLTTEAPLSSRPWASGGFEANGCRLFALLMLLGFRSASTAVSAVDDFARQVEEPKWEIVVISSVLRERLLSIQERRRESCPLFRTTYAKREAWSLNL